MRESDFWKYIRRGLVGKCHITRIESSAGNGVPDVSIGLPNKSIWVELKVIQEWPVRPTTKVKLPLRPEQKLWCIKRGLLSNNVWVIIKIQNDIFLLNHFQINQFTEGLVKSDWYIYACCFWKNSVNFKELYERLLKDY